MSNRFQVGACRALGFKPKLALRAARAGPRGAPPGAAGDADDARQGDANIARASVALPHSEFLAQAHIRTICTRVQFAADACPSRLDLRHARAFTPLLDEPLEGPVYLRSSNNPLPDLVAALRRPDRHRPGRQHRLQERRHPHHLRAGPRRPVSKFVLTMKGGKRGLLENSRNICAHVARATVEMDAHNGKIADSRPELKNSCAGKARARP